MFWKLKFFGTFFFTFVSGISRSEMTKKRMGSMTMSFCSIHHCVHGEIMKED